MYSVLYIIFHFGDVQQWISKDNLAFIAENWISQIENAANSMNYYFSSLL